MVVALKSRTAPVADAVAQSLAAARWLRAQGAAQIYFKFCSTFDSTPRGNIGPVTEALLDALGADFTIASPAFPENERTVFKGHLFVGDVLLSDSGMRNHPLTPMTDANLVRVLQAQLAATAGRRVGLIDTLRGAGRRGDRPALRGAARRGRDAGGGRCAERRRPAHPGPGAPACRWWWPARASRSACRRSTAWRPMRAPPSCRRPAAPRPWSRAAARWRPTHRWRPSSPAGGAALAIDPLQLAAGRDLAADALAWAQPRLASGPVLVYATAEPDAVRAVQEQLGAERAGELVEQALSRIAVGLVEAGVRQLIVAGGETSGACVQALGIRQMRIGPQIDPGVPWCHAASPVRAAGLHLALKSGNFGGVDFFSRAFELL